MNGRRVLVVGSGPSGVHFAQTALERGASVTMIDVGRTPPPDILPDARFDELKSHLDDPSAYFLGRSYEGVLLPNDDREYYGIPPSKQYVFEKVERFAAATHGFEPLFSLARGGLAQVWTAGCYPFNAAELADFPFDPDVLLRHYSEVARRIGVTGETDDLARFMPLHDHLLPPLPLDTHSALLVDRYRRRRRQLNERLGVYLGRTRVATLSRDLGDRRACARLGRCLWGCPVGALYTPSHTVATLIGRPGFEYVNGLEALHFEVTNGRATTLVARAVESGERVTLPVDVLALAAGTLPSAAIMLRSIEHATGERVRLSGLMDNRQVLVPFLNLRMLGRRYDPGAYQYHLLGMGVERRNPREYVHAQLTTLKTALMHPIVQQLPLDLRSALRISRTTHAALGVVNVNLHDTRRENNFVELEDGSPEEPRRLRIHYVPAGDEEERLLSALRVIRRALWQLGCIVPPGMQHVRPMGASVHYAGTFPMTNTAGGSWTTDSAGRSRAFGNVVLADGSTFPFLPAKNLTFTLMANASRVAEEALG